MARAVRGQVAQRAQAAIAEKMQEAAADARMVHRFQTRTGATEQSVERSLIPNGARVIINPNISPYGKFLHRGFRSWAPDPFLQDAVERKTKAMKDSIRRAIVKLMRGV